MHAAFKLRRLSLVTCLAALVDPSLLAAEAPDFERDIAPLLVNHCLDCHQPNKRSGKLNLSTWDSLLAGGEQGPALTPGKAATSLLIERIQAGEMPPPDAKDHRPLSAIEKQTLATWINT